MGGVPAKCLHCKQDLRYDPISLRYLLSRKRERSISLITGFAVSGVVLA